MPLATDTGDAQFVRYLLDHGLDAAMPGEQFLRYAKDNHWGRVVAWLKRHKQG